MPKLESRLAVRTEMDLTRAILRARNVAAEAGFDEAACRMISTAVSELARNILKYAREGLVTIRLLEKDSRLLVEIVVRDDGPGIADVERAMQDNSSTGGTLGLGLPGVRRMMDEFEIDSALGRGTCVKIRKWG
jgi:serine/threonine-protein kinase RsbT